MMQLSGYLPSLEQQIERRRERIDHMRLLHPHIECLYCMDVGTVERGTHMVAGDDEQVKVAPKVEPCPVCDKGKEVKRERERAAWIGRVNDEIGVPSEIQRHVREGDFRQGIASVLRHGIELSQGTYLHGGVGRGKSVAAGAALLEFVRGAGDVGVSPRSLGRFITSADYLQGIRDTYGTGVHQLHVQEGLDRKEMGAKVLVLDDFGSERLTEWGVEQIQSLIDYRTSNGLPTIFTSNFCLDTLEHRINRTRDKSTGNMLYPAGSRIASRIAGACEIIEIKGVDHRRKRKASD